MAEKLTARQVFYKVYGPGKNMITPSVDKRGEICNVGDIRYYYELSHGRAILRDGLLFGVTVVSYNSITGKGKGEHDMSIPHDTIAEAEGYIAELKNKLTKGGK